MMTLSHWLRELASRPQLQRVPTECVLVVTGMVHTLDHAVIAQTLQPELLRPCPQ